MVRSELALGVLYQAPACCAAERLGRLTFVKPARNAATDV